MLNLSCVVFREKDLDIHLPSLLSTGEKNGLKKVDLRYKYLLKPLQWLK